MYSLRQIQVCRWAGTALAVVVLSATFGRWNAFRTAPSPATYLGIVAALTALILMFGSLAVVIYAEEKVRGRLSRNRPFFDRWADRFFLKSDSRDSHDPR